MEKYLAENVIRQYCKKEEN